MCQPLAASPREQAASGECVIEVKRLRVERAGESLDLVLVDRMDCATETLSHVEIFQVE